MVKSRRKTNRPPAHCFLARSTLVASLLINMLLHGCSPQTRHQILTFFFTGVPPLEKEETSSTKPLSLEKAKDKIKKIVYHSHKFFEEGDCGKCHDTSVRFNAPGAADQKRIFRKGMQMPGALLMPAKEICIACHVNKSAAWPQNEGLWLHTPAAQGQCIQCHHAHQSTRPYQLLQKRSQLCKACHAEKKCTESASPGQDPDKCLVCHSPHVGKNKAMLIKDYKEERIESLTRIELPIQSKDRK